MEISGAVRGYRPLTPRIHRDRRGTRDTTLGRSIGCNDAWEMYNYCVPKEPGNCLTQHGGD